MMKNLLLYFFLSNQLFLACSGAPSFDESAKMAEPQMVSTTKDTEPLDDASVERDERKIIKTADYRIQVRDMDQSTENIKVLLKTHGAYFSSMDERTTSYSVDNHLSIRVPNENFEALLNSIGDEAISTQYKRINARDVTEEFVDIEIRLATKTEVRDRYIDILRDKASTVEEILNAEEKIRVLTEEIEAKKGRLRYLKDQVSMSTINLQLYERIPYQAEVEASPSFFSRLGKSFKNGWSMILEFTLFMANLWPVLIILGVVLWRFRVMKKSKPSTNG
jgi:hypothetical protein